MSKDKAPSGFNDEDLERFLVLLDQRALSDLTVKSLVWQFKKQKAKLAECVEVISYLGANVLLLHAYNCPAVHGQENLFELCNCHVFKATKFLAKVKK